MKEFDILKNLIERYKPDNEYLNNLNIKVGNNIHRDVIESLRQFGSKVLFCTGNTAMRNLGFVDKYMDLFKEFKFSVVHYDNISANPTLKQMEEGVKIAKKINPDFIFALGGGSVIDTVKIISVGVYGDVWDFVEKKSMIKSSIPIVASSTTSGTGSHVTPYAVVTNTDTLEKKTLKHLLLLPKLSIVDVDITRFVPQYIVATTGFDVLCHAAEVYTNPNCSEAAKEFATKALTLVGKFLIPSYKNMGIRDKIGIAFADLYAGIALALIGTHVPHAISHPISARFPLITHGQSLAYIMGETSRIIIEKGNKELKLKFNEMSRLLGRDDFIKTIEYFRIKLGLDRKLQKFSKQDTELIIKDCLGYRKPSINRSPTSLSEDDIRTIVYNSLLNNIENNK